MLRRKRSSASPKVLPVWVAWSTLAVVALILVSGVGFLAWRASGGGSHAGPPPSPSAIPATASVDPGLSPERQRDAIAARPMLEGDSSNLDPANFKPKPEVQATTAPLKLPNGTGEEAGVKTGFTHTPEGAVAQLAALNAAAYSNLSVDAGRAAYEAFAMPGAVALQEWNPTKVVMRYYTDNSDTDPTKMRATFTPVQGLIKGNVGPDFTVVCINGQVTYSYEGHSNRVAVWDCARMQWRGSRWNIAPGTTPARAPLAWPRSALTYQAGFRDLQNVPG